MTCSPFTALGPSQTASSGPAGGGSSSLRSRRTRSGSSQTQSAIWRLGGFGSFCFSESVKVTVSRAAGLAREQRVTAAGMAADRREDKGEAGGVPLLALALALACELPLFHWGSGADR